jgi:hypothetical protein
MDANNLRRCVWDEMILAEMRANYFAELVGHYLRLDKWLRVAVLVAASGTVGTALSQWDTSIRLSVPIIATAVSFWLLISQYGSMSRDASDLHSGWNTVAHDYERLWNNLESSDTEEQYHQIYDRAELLSKSGTKFPNKRARLNYWLDQAAKIATARYA